MKKLLLGLLSVGCTACLSVDLAGCSFFQNNASTSTEKEIWTMETVYAKAQSLGFEGTLEEFIALISGKDGKDGGSFSRYD